MKTPKTLWILVFVCLINSMGFGMMIPLIYEYGKKFGVTKETLGLLTAAFSVAQFFSTPVLGKLSDRFGRKWILVCCLFGTCASLILFGLANSILILFIARILDGATGGDISVAQAMVSDLSSSENRAKNFGILGSAFGIGSIAGPAVGGLLSHFGMTFPFFFAAGLAFMGALLSMFFLTDTTNSKQTIKKTEAFNYRSLLTVLKRPVVGAAVLTGFLLTTAQFIMLIGFQTFSADGLKLSPTQIGIFYAGFGICGVLAQLTVPLVTKLLSKRSVILIIAVIICLISMVACGFLTALIPFAVAIGIYGLANGYRTPMVNAIIADHNPDSKQGEILGINQAYTSLGQTIGPAAAGLAATIALNSIFFLAAAFMLFALIANFKLKREE